MDTSSSGLHCGACGRVIQDSGSWFCGYCGTYVLGLRRHKILRYDGVYVTRPEIEKGIVSRSYFRFYPDRFVIGIVFGSSKDKDHGVATWWGRRSHDGMKGYYRIKGRDIEFACTGDSGTTVYVGKVRKDGLRITSSNGKSCSIFYRFVCGQEGVETRPSVDPALSVADQDADVEVTDVTSPQKANL